MGLSRASPGWRDAPGKVFKGKCHIGFGGKEVPLATFEMLVRTPS